MKKTIIVLSACLLFLLTLLFTQWMEIIWSNKTMYISCQPTQINYGSNQPYCLSIIRQEQSLSTSYFILVANKQSPEYGHVINYPGSGSFIEQDLKELKINWTEEGIELETYLNTKISIPKKNFIGGR